MQSESTKHGTDNRQREASDAATGTGGSQRVGAGAQERGTREDWDRSAEPCNETNTKPPSTKATGTQERGTLEDWERGANAEPQSDQAAGTQERGTREDWERNAEADNATQAAADANSTAGGSVGQRPDDRTSREEPETFRNGTFRD